MTFKFEEPRATPSEEPSGLREVPRISESAAPGASGSHAAPHDHPARKRALLVGSPNVGKSVLFGALTGRYVTVSNYPGTTVEITRGKISFDDHASEPWELLDSPGTNNLVAMSEDEAVTRDILLTERQDALVQVGDAKNLARTLLMTFQLAELGVPFLLNLNMMDEAAARGLQLDFEALRKELTGIEVNSSAAIRGEGIEPIRHYLVRASAQAEASETSDAGAPISDETPKRAARAPLPCIPTFPEDVEAAIARVEAQLVEAATSLEVAPRAVATLLLSGDRGLGGALETMVSPAVREAARLEAEALSAAHSMPVFALLNKLRLGRAQAIVRTVQTKTGGKSRSATEGSKPVTWPTSLFTAAIGSAIAAWWFAGFTWPSAVLFALAFPLSAVVVRRHVQARVAAWKLAFAFAAGYFVWFFVSLVPPFAAAIAPVIGALVGLGSLAYFARVGDHKDSDNARRFGRLAVHPVWGVPILLVVLFFAYKIVGEFGAGTAVDFLENGAFGSVSARTELTAPVAADIGAGDTAAEGAERLLVVPAGTPAAHLAPDGTSVLAQVKTGGAYVAEPDARVDFYPAKNGAPAEARIWSGFANRAAFAFFTWLGIPLLTAFFVGTYGMLTMGVTYAVAIVLPVVATFFFVFSMLEDSGYLPRLAVMANRQLRVIGLNGKAVLPMVLGLGCDTMATLTARILETKKERVLVTLLLALGIPCSSQLSVVFALMQRTSPIASVAWVASVLLTIGIVGWVSAKVIPGDKSDFLLEMPPIRRPQIGNLATKTFARIEWYLREAVPLFLAGTALLFVLDKFDLLVYVHRAGEPIVHGVLGFTRDRLVSDKVSEALLIGFLRRDFGAAGLLDLARGGQLSTADIAVSMVTITLFIPCIANVFMIVKERGWKVGTAMCAFIFPYAVLVGWMVRGGFSLAHRLF
jgi:Fe2+ transport system protein B